MITLNITIREIHDEDVGVSLIETLNNLSSCGELTTDSAREILREIQKNPLHRIVGAFGNGKIVGCATILFEQKFIHNGGMVAHIEDVVVKEGYQGKGIGYSLVKDLVSRAKKRGCYKAILDCNDSNIQFYESLGFRKHETEMRVDL